HAKVQRIFGREGADAEQRHGYRVISGAHESSKCFHRARNDDAVSSEDERTFCGVQQFHRAIEFRLVVIYSLTFWWKFWRSSIPIKFPGSLLRILGDIH